MNKAFIAICFWQSLPDLPPLGRHVPLTVFYRLVKGKYIFFKLFSTTPSCLWSFSRLISLGLSVFNVKL